MKNGLSPRARMTSVKSEIDHHEHIEETITGPKQRMLKEAMLKFPHKIPCPEECDNSWTPPKVVFKSFLCFPCFYSDTSGATAMT